MSYYHTKNIKMNKEKNIISADLADSSWSPLRYTHVENLYPKSTSFEESYADLMSDIINGNFHPTKSSEFYPLCMKFGMNYYDDVRDIGTLNTYNKYKDEISEVIQNPSYKSNPLPRDRELNPKKYYSLIPVNVDTKYDYNYFEDSKGKLFCIDDGKLSICGSDPDHKNSYGYPLYNIYDDFDGENAIDKYMKYSPELCDLINKDKVRDNDLELDL